MAMKKIILFAAIFCLGVGFIVSSPSYGRSGLLSFEPFAFALGLLICIISGVPLVKAIREYLR